MKKIKIKNYFSARSFLQDYLKLNGLSISQFSKNLNLKDHSSLSKFLRAERGIGKKIQKKLALFFSFSPLEEEQFFDLFIFDGLNQSSPMKQDFKKKKIIEEQKLRLQSKRRGELDSLLHEWVTLVIRELVRLKRFRTQNFWPINLFRFSVSQKIIEKSIDELIKKNILQMNEEGGFDVPDEFLNFGDSFPNFNIARYHEAGLELAKDSLKRDPMLIREFGSLILPMKDSDLQLAKKMIQEFRQEFSQRFDSGENGDRINRLQIQFFPLTNKL